MIKPIFVICNYELILIYMHTAMQSLAVGDETVMNGC